VLISLLNLAMPWLVANLVDLVVQDQGLAELNRVALALGGLFVLRAVFGFGQAYLVAWVGERVVADLRREIYEHLLSLSLGFFAGQRVGEILSRLTNDVRVIQTAVTRDLVMLLQQAVTAIGVVVIVSAMDWRLTALMAIAVPGMVLLTRLMGRQIRRASRLVQDTLAQASVVAEETVSGIRAVKSFAREDYEAARFGQQVDTILETAMHRTRIYATLGPLISFLMYGTLALVLWVGGQEVLHGRLTPGQLIAFLLYAAMLTGPLGSFAGLYGRVQEALGATERVFEVLDAHPEIDWRAMAGMRDKLIHGYFGVDYDIVWDVVRNKTGLLSEQIRRILESQS